MSEHNIVCYDCGAVLLSPCSTLHRDFDAFLKRSGWATFALPHGDEVSALSGFRCPGCKKKAQGYKMVKLP